MLGKENETTRCHVPFVKMMGSPPHLVQEVAETSLTGQVLTLSLVATTPTAICPLCGQASLHIRSSYTRHVADVPSAGRQVQLILSGFQPEGREGACRMRILPSGSRGCTSFTRWQTA